MIKFPRQLNQEGGWTIDVKFLSRLTDFYDANDGDFNAGMEEVECVLMALERLIESNSYLTYEQITGMPWPKSRSHLKIVVSHDSDCAVHNEPAMPNGPCDCDISQAEDASKSEIARLTELCFLYKEKILALESHIRLETVKWKGLKAHPVGLQELGRRDIQPKNRCANKDEKGGCSLHNLQCGYPECDI